MKKNKLLFLVTIFFCMFFSLNNEVYAKDSYAKCWYSITGEKTLSNENSISLYLEAKNGNVSYKFEKYIPSVSGVKYKVDASLVKSIPFDAMKDYNDSNKLKCPVIYYKKETGFDSSTRTSSASYTMSVYKEDLPGDSDRKSMIVFKRDITEESSSSVLTSKSCSYYKQNSNNPLVIINVSSDGSVQIPSPFTKSDTFNDELFNNTCHSELYVCNGISRIYSDKSNLPNYDVCPGGISTITYKQSDLSADGQYDENGTATDNFGNVIDIPTGAPMTCESLKSTNTYKIIKSVFGWIQIASPIMLVIFGVLDFGKAVLASDNDAIKKAQSAFVKRCIIVVAIILLPIIMDLLFTLLDGAMGNNISGCDIGK